MKPPSERGRNAEHIEALEAFRLSEATLYRFQNYHRVTNGWSAERFATEPEFVALVADRDECREAVKAADPKWGTA